MVRYCITFEVFGDVACLQNLKEFCKERGLMFERCERFDSDTYKELRALIKEEFGLTDVFRAWITFKDIPNHKHVLSELKEREDIDIWIKVDM